MNLIETIRPMKWYLKDLYNKTIYLHNAPKFAQAIYVNPKDIDLFRKCKSVSGTGKVVGGNWDLNLERSEDAEIKYKFCKMHWIEGVPWDETGVYDYLMEKIKFLEA